MHLFFFNFARDIFIRINNHPYLYSIIEETLYIYLLKKRTQMSIGGCGGANSCLLYTSDAADE